MPFQIDPTSNKRLFGVHPDLVKIVQDCARNWSASFVFGVSCGLRTLAQQKQDVASGVSTTLKSRHLDGHAVDLTALVSVAGTSKLQISWSWPLYYQIAQQMRASGIRLKIPLNWGGVWDREMSDMSDDMQLEAHEYVARRLAAKARVFQDGPHFQLPFAQYPSAGEPALRTGPNGAPV